MSRRWILCHELVPCARASRMRSGFSLDRITRSSSDARLPLSVLSVCTSSVLMTVSR